jgi:hypothetical protein
MSGLLVPTVPEILVIAVGRIQSPKHLALAVSVRVR